MFEVALRTECMLWSSRYKGFATSSESTRSDTKARREWTRCGSNGYCGRGFDWSSSKCLEEA
jgi:hypothetical protein